MKKRVFRRIFWPALTALLLGIAVSEGAFLLLKERNRPPQEIVLTIPRGTAAEVAAGRSPLGIPETLSFVLGDTLVVRNEDVVDHQLGPLWIPPGATARLQLDQAQKYAFACTFQPTRYLGIDVEEPVTLWTRLGGLSFTVLPMMVLFITYSFVLWPLDKDDDRNAAPDV